MHTYPRKIEGAIRQGNTVRAEARQRKQERKQQERAKQEAEIQRLKTLKRREIEARYLQTSLILVIYIPAREGPYIANFSQ